MEKIYRITAFWYTRIIAFVLLLVLCVGVYGWAVGFANEEVYVLVLAVSLLVEHGRKQGAWYALGLHYRWATQQILTGLAFALVCIASIGGVAVVLGATWGAAETMPTLPVLAGQLAMLAWAAAGEELLFRGVVFQALFERFGSAVAILLMSVLFSAVHLFNPSMSTLAFVNVLLAGAVFSLMYVHTRSLWLPWAFHFGWNAAQYYLLASPVSGWWFGYPLLELRAGEGGALYQLALGDSFGIESGLATTVVLLVVMGVVSLPAFAKVPPELAARLFKRQYAESALRAACRVPWGRRLAQQRAVQGEAT